MRKRYKTISSNLICPECGNIFPIPRYSGRYRCYNHIKDLWCPYCRDTTKMVENKREVLTMAGDLIVW